MMKFLKSSKAKPKNTLSKRKKIISKDSDEESKEEEKEVDDSD